jgi:hypothetical protein
MSKKGNEEIFEVGPYTTKITTAAKKNKKNCIYLKDL